MKSVSSKNIVFKPIPYGLLSLSEWKPTTWKPKGGFLGKNPHFYLKGGGFPAFFPWKPAGGFPSG